MACFERQQLCFCAENDNMSQLAHKQQEYDAPFCQASGFRKSHVDFQRQQIYKLRVTEPESISITLITKSY